MSAIWTRAVLRAGRPAPPVGSDQASAGDQTRAHPARKPTTVRTRVRGRAVSRAGSSSSANPFSSWTTARPRGPPRALCHPTRPPRLPRLRYPPRPPRPPRLLYPHRTPLRSFVRRPRPHPPLGSANSQDRTSQLARSVGRGASALRVRAALALSPLVPWRCPKAPRHVSRRGAPWPTSRPGSPGRPSALMWPALPSAGRPPSPDSSTRGAAATKPFRCFSGASGSGWAPGPTRRAAWGGRPRSPR
mmetsp:Transcript_64773/g.146106  ORF Transcript_64773/g.146106 Transcript_64773/m.146106 type:complete len:246 (-) Transcript_64773:703-1440(-)